MSRSHQVRAQRTASKPRAARASTAPAVPHVGSNTDRAARLAPPEAWLDAQAGDVDALFGPASTEAPSLELHPDAPYAAAAVGTLSAAAQDPVFKDCAFGETTRDLRDAPHLLVTCGSHHREAATLSGLLAAQLVAGLAEDGWADGGGLDELFRENIDEEGIYVNHITLLTTGERFEWLEFFSGDTECGYLFRAGTAELVGCVGDGEIYGSPIQLPTSSGAD